MSIERYPYALPPLPYQLNALEPYINEQTVFFHYEKHFKTYIDNLNKALEPYPALQQVPLTMLLARLNTLPSAVRTPIRHNGGGVYNHNLYFHTLRPPVENNEPEGALAEAIKRRFGSFPSFKEQMTQKALDVFGSGYANLVVTRGGRLEIMTTPNQDTPLMLGARPLLLFDVWEHAYYLQYQNLRNAYVEGIWSLINYDAVEY